MRVAAGAADEGREAEPRWVGGRPAGRVGVRVAEAEAGRRRGLRALR